jgi:hypothetical protein
LLFKNLPKPLKKDNKLLKKGNKKVGQWPTV